MDEGFQKAVKSTGDGFVLTRRTTKEGSMFGLISPEESEETIVVQPKYSVAHRDAEHYKNEEEKNKLNLMAIEEATERFQEFTENKKQMLAKHHEMEIKQLKNDGFIKKNNLELENKKKLDNYKNETKEMVDTLKLNTKVERKKKDNEHQQKLFELEKEKLKIEYEPKIASSKRKNEKLKKELENLKHNYSETLTLKNQLINNKDEKIKKGIEENKIKKEDIISKSKYENLVEEEKKLNENIKKLKEKKSTLKNTIETIDKEIDAFDDKKNELKILLDKKDNDHQDQIIELMDQYAEIESKRSD